MIIPDVTAPVLSQNSLYSYALGSTALLAVIATIIVRVVPVRHPQIKTILSYFSALAAGSLLGDALLYLIPKAAEDGWNTAIATAALAGVMVMLITEQMITWRESDHKKRHSKVTHAAISNMFGFTTQSFIDGLVIASGYMISLSAGIATTLAVIIHQIPQEISNFVILRRAGISNALANRISILAVGVSFVGALMTLLIPDITKAQLLYLSAPFTAGVFLYTALAELVPDMLTQTAAKKSFIQIILLGVGIGLIALIKYSKHAIGGLD